MKKDYKDYLTSLFKRKTAYLGSELVNFLSHKFPISNDYSRKIINIAVKERILYSSKPIRFSHGQFGYSTIKNKSVFKQLLKNKTGLKEIQSMLYQTCLPENEMIKIALSMYTSLGQKEALQKLVQDLNFFDRVEKKEFEGCEFYYFKSCREDTASDGRCSEILRNLKKDAKICQLIYSYFLNMNIISSGVYRSTDEPWKLIGENTGFDLICYSTLGNRQSQNKTTLLFDVQVAYRDNERAIKRFIKRAKAYAKRLSYGDYKYKAKIINAIVVREVNAITKSMIDPKDNYLWVGLRQLFGRSIDSYLWLIGQDAKEANRTEVDGTLYERIERLAQSDFPYLFGQFLDDYFEIIVNSCIGKMTSKLFHGEIVSHDYTYKEFDGFYEDEKSVWVIESKNLGKSLIKWRSEDSKGKIENDCLEYFFVDKMNYLRRAFPGKEIYACYVSKSGFSKGDESERKIAGVSKMPGLGKYLLTPKELLAAAGKLNTSKEFNWLDKLFIPEDD